MAELSKEQENHGLPDRQPRSRSALWLGILGIILLIGLAGLVFFLDIQHQGKQKSLAEQVTTELSKKDQQVLELTQQISGYQNQIAAIQSQLATVQQDTSGKDTHFKQVLDDFTKLHTEKLDVTRNELKGSIDQVQRLLGKTRSDWLLADAEYLLTIANERLQLMGDVATAKRALEAADTRLHESEDPAVFKVREQLSKEINELNKVSALDIVGIYSKLSAMQQSVKKLSVFLPYVGKEKQPIESESAEEQEVYQGWLGGLLKNLKPVIAVRHSSKPASGIISREEAQFSYQQLSVRLEMVKMALIQQNETMYLTALEDVKQWLNENFTINANANDFLKQLTELQSIKIRSHLPDIGESAKLLKDITKLRVETDKVLPSKLAITPEVSKPTPGADVKPVEAVAAPSMPSTPAAVPEPNPIQKTPSSTKQ